MDLRKNKIARAYLIGLALGDGNLSNPNGRAIRLRITCDNKYPLLKKKIISVLRTLFPKNKIAIIKRAKSYCDINVYSNNLSRILPWHVGKGSKYNQKAHVPEWIFKRKKYIHECLRGLLQTDGSIYSDRGYTMVNFTNNTYVLARNVYDMITMIEFKPSFHRTINSYGNKKYTVRLARNVDAFTKLIGLVKT